VNLRVGHGEIHALVGENGAGKSTLMKVLSGLYPHGSYTGEILVDGEEMRFSNIKDSEDHGIAVIYQELALVKLLNIAENIFLGNEIQKHGVISWNKAYSETSKYLKEVGLELSPETVVGSLGIGQQQLIEIAKALSKDAKILVLDEPTAALNETDSQNLLNILRELKKKGVTCIYISHKLEEIVSIADTITILRDGRTVETEPMRDPAKGVDSPVLVTEDRIISLMVGRTITNRFPRKAHSAGDVIMEVKNWTVHDPEIPERKIVDDISLKIRKGEILGLAGLMGAGRTELSMRLFGAYGIGISGEMYIEGKRRHIRSPKDAIDSGFAYLSEDRKGNGLVLIQDIRQNASLASLGKISRGGVINQLREISRTNEYVGKLKIKTPSLEQYVKNLSGGNQQKVVIAKWMLAEPKILILDEPTRGIDVGAKFEIYNIMNDLVDQGVAIVMISSELPEILGMADRIAVIHEGRLAGELDHTEATPEKVMYYATGGK
jgi:ABC-type sugar transport system ATPase subunit